MDHNYAGILAAFAFAALIGLVALLVTHYNVLNLMCTGGVK